jgi:acyl transferase domain-containing protein
MLSAMHAKGAEVFVEVGPDAPLARRAPPHLRGVWIPTLWQGREDGAVFLEALGNLFVRGAIVDLRALGRPPPTRTSVLPTYPFQRKRYWLDLPPSPAEGEASVRTRPRRDVIREMAQVGADERPRLLRSYVAAEVAWVLGAESPGALRADQPLNEAGLDSNLAVDLLTALRRDLRLELPETLLYEYPTLGMLVKYLEREVLGGGVRLAGEAGPPGRRSPGGSPDSPA